MRNRGLRALYTATELSVILWETLQLKNSNADLRSLGEVQQEYLQKHLSGFKYDFATASIIRVDKHKRPLDVKSYLHNFSEPDDVVLASYYEAIEHDHLSKLVYMNPGWALSHQDVFPGPPENHAFFQQHASKFGFAKSYSLGFYQPLHDRVFLAFDYLGSIENPTWEAFDPEVLELASFPFALAWLHLSDHIGERVLEEHFAALSDLKPFQLAMVRVFINQPDIGLKKQADAFGCGYNHFKKSIYQIKDKIAIQFDDAVASEQKVPLIKLQRYCHLFNILPDKSRGFVRIDGIEMTSEFERRLKAIEAARSRSISV